jgi:lactate 2-monooxygenase
VSSLLRRAEACGCEAIVVTLDTTLFGWRCRDLDLAYLPFALGKGIAQYTSDPVFTAALRPAALEREGRPTVKAVSSLVRATRAYPGGFLANLRSGLPIAAVREFLATYSRPSLTWDDLPWLRGQTRLPVLLKGLLHPDDARLAVEHGVDGIVVSTQDGAIGSLDALPGVVEAVGGRIPVLLDSGVRGGADAFKALALGAAAVLIGRPYVYGLALGGEQGVREVIRNFAAELDLTVGLAGRRSVAELGPECLESVT